MTSSANKSHVILANTIKFGLPLGLAASISRIGYALFFSADGITGETIGAAATSFVIFLLVGIVLGLIRSSK